MCAESLTFHFIQTQRPLLTPNSTTATRRRRGVNGSQNQELPGIGHRPLALQRQGLPSHPCSRDGSPQKRFGDCCTWSSAESTDPHLGASRGSDIQWTFWPVESLISLWDEVAQKGGHCDH